MAVSVCGLALVALSPAVLRLARGEDKEWERLSLIGQTYGAISALIAVLALLGVVATLVYQARELRRTSDENRRQAMGDLLRMAMDDPDLDECWGPVDVGSSAKARRQQMYTNMIVTQWGTAFRAGATPEKRLRANAVEMFRGPVGRAYWAAARGRRLAAPGSRLEKRFNQILDEAYAEASALPSASEEERLQEAGARVPRAAGHLGWVGPAVAGFGLGGAVTGAVLAGLRRRSAR